MGTTCHRSVRKLQIFVSMPSVHRLICSTKINVEVRQELCQRILGTCFQGLQEGVDPLPRAANSRILHLALDNVGGRFLLASSFEGLIVLYDVDETALASVDSRENRLSQCRWYPFGRGKRPSAGSA